MSSIILMLYCLAVASLLVARQGVSAQCSDSLTGARRSTGYLNEMDQALAWHVPDGYAIVGMYSYHSNHDEDRRFGFHYQNIKDRDIFTTRQSLGITQWDAYFSKSCGYGYFLTYINSWHSNSKEDRQWNFRCSRVRASTLTNCFWTSYVNNFDERTSYSAPPNGRYVIAGVSSYHHNGAEDRRFKFKVCELILH